MLRFLGIPAIFVVYFMMPSSALADRATSSDIARMEEATEEYISELESRDAQSRAWKALEYALSNETFQEEFRDLLLVASAAGLGVPPDFSQALLQMKSIFESTIELKQDPSFEVIYRLFMQGVETLIPDFGVLGALKTATAFVTAFIYGYFFAP